MNNQKEVLGVKSNFALLFFILSFFIGLFFILLGVIYSIYTNSLMMMLIGIFGMPLCIVGILYTVKWLKMPKELVVVEGKELALYTERGVIIVDIRDIKKVYIARDRTHMLSVLKIVTNTKKYSCKYIAEIATVVLKMGKLYAQ